MEKERRRFKRFETFVSVKYKTHGNESQSGLGLSRDLSRGGMKLACNDALSKGTVVDLELDIPDDPKPVRGKGEIAWAKKVKGAQKGSGEKDRDYDVGIKFVAIDPVDKFRALDYAYNNWLENKVNDYSDPEVIPGLR